MEEKKKAPQKVKKTYKPQPVSRKKRLTEAEKVYKSRHAVFERVSIVLFLAVLFFTGLCLVFLKRPDFSESEKRELEKKPELTIQSYLDGSFASQFTAYFSDTVPFREEIVELNAKYDSIKGISAPKFYGNVNVVADDDGNLIGEETTAAVTETQPAVSETLPGETASEGDVTPAVSETTAPETTVSETETEEEEEVENIADFANNGIVVDSVKMYGDNAGVMLFGGNKKMGTRYAELISRYKEAMGPDVNVYNIVVPTSVEFYLPKKFQKYSSSEKDAIEHIYNSYTADVIPVDAYSEIAAHTDEYIYLRTDHHWSHRGAYYAYAALVKAMGETPKDIDKDYEVREIDGYVGSLYGYTNDPILKNSPELFTYYKPKSNYKTYYYDYDTLKPKGEGTLFYDNVSPGYAYGVFIGSDAIHTQIVTENNTGRKVCVFKESYGNAFVPYLVDSFDEIYVIDIRYFGRNAVEYMKEKGITDVIFINNAFAANTSSLIDGIEKLYTNPYGTLDDEKIAAVQPYYATSETTVPVTAAAEADNAPAEPASPSETAAPVQSGETPVNSDNTDGNGVSG
ncbi:DHHW family protein [Huintestinicola sp.]|uniref:DHHW family protein n=1 Tax=Huintestinicola sp. TaxID=2981661 RepID=UPI003D7DD7D0